MSVRYPVATSGPDGSPASAASPGEESGPAETISHGPVAVGVGVTSVLAPHPASVSATTASGTAIVRSDMTPPGSKLEFRLSPRTVAGKALRATAGWPRPDRARGPPRGNFTGIGYSRYRPSGRGR